MADVAARLRTAREHAGLTIDDIAARTKIKPATLEAIERGEFERLPGEFFTRAFLRSYARELRLPVDEVMGEYDAGRPAPAAPVAEPPNHDAEPQFLAAVQEFLLPRMTSALVALAILLVTVVMLVDRPEPVKETEQGAVGTSGATPATTEAAPHARASAVPAPPPRLTVAISPSRRLWVTGHADGKRVLFRNIAPGEQVVVDGADVLSFRVGDAGAFEYTLNGSPGKAPGRPGEVREFRITRDNYREFVR